MKRLALLSAFGVTLLVFSCKKEDTQTTVNIRMTDGPGDYQQVNVDIQEVRVKTSDDTLKWLTLPTNAGVYNLLDYQNGVDTLIASGQLPPVVLKEVRFILGSNNTIMVDSLIYPLQTPSAEDSGLKVKIDKDLGLTPNSFTLDFDAALSVKENGNGDYILKPVIKLK